MQALGPYGPPAHVMASAQASHVCTRSPGLHLRRYHARPRQR